MSFVMGNVPQDAGLMLNADGDFSAALLRKDGVDWEDDVEAIIVFSTGDEWAASRDGARLVWNVDEAVVDALLAKSPPTARLFYVRGDVRLLWARLDVYAR
jgi:hypothetical protein